MTTPIRVLQHGTIRKRAQAICIADDGLLFADRLDSQLGSNKNKHVSSWER